MPYLKTPVDQNMLLHLKTRPIVTVKQSVKNEQKSDFIDLSKNNGNSQ